MKRVKSAVFAAAIMAISAGTAVADPLPAGWTSVGVGGTNTAADGVVTLAPGFGSYQWITTTNGANNAGSLGVGSETNGAFAQTPTFTVAANDKLNFYFNYITSDGAGFADYAWAGLFNGAALDKTLFTARTKPTGDTVPGFGLPGISAGVTLTPATTAIIPGGPAFSPLGSSTGTCFAAGCGYTGWIQMEFIFAAAGTYSLGFGVVNWADTAFDSAFAIAGVTINDKPIDGGGGNVPEPGTLALAGLALVGLAATRRRRAA